MAGGIGVTPFRSMVKYLLDKNEVRDIVLFYCVKTADELAYKGLFDEASQKFGLKVHYIISDTAADKLPKDMESGRLTTDLIKQEVPDFAQRIFYISGPQGMVTGLKETLQQAGVPGRNTRSDYFPGFA